MFGIQKKLIQDPDVLYWGQKSVGSPIRNTVSCRVGNGSGTCKLGAGNELETLHLAEVCGVAEHVYVEELGHIAAAPQRVLLPYRVPDIRAFLNKETISGVRRFS